MGGRRGWWAVSGALFYDSDDCYINLYTYFYLFEDVEGDLMLWILNLFGYGNLFL